MLKFYIISTIISALIIYISIASANSELKRQGYKRQFKPTVAESMRGLMLALIPILNILLAVVAIFKYDEVVEEMKKEWIKEGQARVSMD